MPFRQDNYSHLGSIFLVQYPGLPATVNPSVAECIPKIRATENTATTNRNQTASSSHRELLANDRGQLDTCLGGSDTGWNPSKISAHREHS